MKIRRVLTGRAYWLTTTLLAFLALAESGNAFAKTTESKPAPQAAPQRGYGKLLGIDRRTAGR